MEICQIVPHIYLLSMFTLVCVTLASLYVQEETVKKLLVIVIAGMLEESAFA